jgi:N-acetylglucosamine kinase-like BadF-type ATPase
MILIADSGSTKTDWALVDHHQAVREIKTKGLNPFQVSGDEIAAELRSSLLPLMPTTALDAIYFYGAGCTPEKQPVVEQALRSVLTVSGPCTVASDMLGAAIAVCGHEPGIACILGTGSNSCAYDGQRIVKNVSPLGFILGDEGSGASMGKYLLGNILKHQWPETIINRFHEHYGLTAAEIIDRVYRQPRPNTFLASFMPFITQNLHEPVVYEFVKDNFRTFLRRNVKQYDGWERLPIGFNGSIAQVLRSPLEEVLQEEGMHLGRIVQAPMEGLVQRL